jgi:hypothetical protein
LKAKVKLKVVFKAEPTVRLWVKPKAMLEPMPAVGQLARIFLKASGPLKLLLELFLKLFELRERQHQI